MSNKRPKIKFKRSDSYLRVWQLEHILKNYDKTDTVVVASDEEGNDFKAAYCTYAPFFNAMDMKTREIGHWIDENTTTEEMEDYDCYDEEDENVKKVVIISP